ncbi:MAG TPA: DUF2079 domain-containing protein [Vicinamibacterales bacterium]
MNNRFPAAVGVMAALVGSAYALYGLFRHWHFGSSAYDLGIFDQAVWHLSRLEAPASTIRGVSNLFGDHFHPVIALFAPLYWIWSGPETLIVAQAALLAASVIPVFLYARDRLSACSAHLVAAAYALFWAIQRMMAFDVHELAFAPLAIATAILAMERRQWTAFWIAAGSLMLIKEDLIPLLTGFGAYLFVRGERRRGAALVAASLVSLAVVVGIIVPGFNDAGRYEYTSAVTPLMREPWRIPVALVTPPVKLVTLFMWLAPFLFLPLASPLILVAVPVMVERFLSASPNHWGTVFHYSAPLAPILAMSAADGLARLGRAHPRPITAAAAAMVVLCAVLPGRQPLWRVFAAGHYRGTPAAVTGRHVVALVPPGASVVAQATIVPHLSQRSTIYVLQPLAPESEYVVAQADLSPWPNVSRDALQRLVDERQRRGYVVIYARDGWVLLRGPSRDVKDGNGTGR